MADPSTIGSIGGGIAAGGGALGLIIAWCKRLDSKKQDVALCSERNKACERRFTEGNARFTESEARDKVMANDMFDVKLAVHDIQKDMKQLLKVNGGSNGSNERSPRG